MLPSQIQGRSFRTVCLIFASTTGQLSRKGSYREKSGASAYAVIAKVSLTVAIPPRRAGSAYISFHSARSPIALVIPIVCGCLAALIVRGITVSTPTKQKKAWRFELLVTLLVLLITRVVVEEEELSVMNATLLGMFFGSLGIGVIKIARNASVAMLEDLMNSVDTSKP